MNWKKQTVRISRIGCKEDRRTTHRVQKTWRHAIWKMNNLFGTQSKIMKKLLREKRIMFDTSVMPMALFWSRSVETWKKIFVLVFWSSEEIAKKLPARAWAFDRYVNRLASLKNIWLGFQMTSGMTISFPKLLTINALTVFLRFFRNQNLPFRRSRNVQMRTK